MGKGITSKYFGGLGYLTKEECYRIWINTNMKIIFLNGGLANQTFQYIFYRFCQMRHPECDWVLDDSFFYVNNVHNGYELESVFGVSPHLLSKCFDEDVWEYMMLQKRNENKSIPQILNENGLSYIMIAEYDNYKIWNPFDGEVQMIPSDVFLPEIADLPGDIYYHGYWLRKDFLDLYGDAIRSELVFPPIDEQNNEIMNQIKSTNSAALHIRRGDFVKNGIALDEQTIYQSVSILLKKIPDATLFVFSDDIDYCRNKAEDLGLNLAKETFFVTGNTGADSYKDMQLMSACKNVIINNSSFCYLAALLNNDINVLINPTKRAI